MDLLLGRLGDGGFSCLILLLLDKIVTSRLCHTLWLLNLLDLLHLWLLEANLDWLSLVVMLDAVLSRLVLISLVFIDILWEITF